MSKEKFDLTIEVDTEAVVNSVSIDAMKEIISRYDRNYGIKKGVEEACKELIYSRKDKIIEEVIRRATVEICKKGMPKFIDKMIERSEVSDD